MAENGEWLRARGIGRERFAGYLSDYLGNLGYAVERTDSTDPAESHLLARLQRPNPAVPSCAKELRFRFFPTSGGAALVWQDPREVPREERARMDRMVRELVSHLERAISTESHATAKVTTAPSARLPWQPEKGPQE